MLAASLFLLSACDDDAACRGSEATGTARSALVGGESETEASAYLVSVERSRFTCTGVVIGGGWVVTAAHCVSGESEDVVVHPKLDLALLRSGDATERPALALYVGSVPEQALAVAPTTADQATADRTDPLTFSRALVAIWESGHEVIVSEVAEGGPRLCSGDSGSALLVERDSGLALLGIFSQSSGGNTAALCTPAFGLEYWVRAQAAQTFLQDHVGNALRVEDEGGPVSSGCP